jgi:hypothetical protein
MTIIKLFAFTLPEEIHLDTFNFWDPFLYNVENSPVFRLSKQDFRNIVEKKRLIGKPILDTHDPVQIGVIVDAYIGEYDDLVVLANINNNIDNPSKYEVSISYRLLFDFQKDGKVKIIDKIPIEVSLCRHGSQGRQAGNIFFFF